MQQESWKVRIVIHDQRDGTLGNPEWGAIKGGSKENLQPSRNGFCPLGKNDKKREQPKAEFERVRSLEKNKKSRTTPWPHPGMESQPWAFKETTPEGGNYEE